ncbi:hypothetical protein ACHAXT_004057 [Thalassiosira profunda]
MLRRLLLVHLALCSGGMALPPSAATLRHAQEWARRDFNPKTAGYVHNLVSQSEGGDDASGRELESLFPVAPGTDASNYELSKQPRIGFGTAGLRGRMAPGPLCMNDLTVVQTAQGLAKYVLRCREQELGNTPLKAVVGYDHRACSQFDVSSRQFAIYTKLVFEHAGIDCLILDAYVATPLLAYAVTHINAAVGIMVTASHNPKQDDGYKVYWKDSCQIRPPVDKDIADAIVEESNLVPWIAYGAKLQQLKTASDSECCGLSDPDATRRIEDAYFQSIRDSGLVASNVSASASASTPRFAYTAMHGVGHPFAKRSFKTFRLPPFLAVPSQQTSDPDFPTVPFPNPEEKGALDEAMAFAEKNACDIVLANDPDADRLAVAELCKKSGEWKVFKGDEVGTLLGVWLWEMIGKRSAQPVAMLASTVSSKMLAAVGEMEGFLFEETLTGFKWIGSRALALQDQGYRVLLGYEEAIGYACGGVIPDKDGVSALGVMATLATSVYSRGETLASHLQQIHDKYGEFVSNNGYYFCSDPAIVKRVLEQMRNDGKYFESVGGYEVQSVRDLGSPGYDSSTQDKKPTLPTSASSPMLTFRFKNGCVAQFRASGTEPKFKYYIEMRGKPGEKKDAVERRLSEMCGVILEELLHPQENGLILPSHL